VQNDKRTVCLNQDKKDGEARKKYYTCIHYIDINYLSPIIIELAPSC
jgi:hypothetical protein